MPDDFLDIPVVDKKKYVLKYKAKSGERKRAIRFLKQNLDLSKKELKTIKMKHNTKSAIEMQEWLLKYGLDEENKKFIYWGINQLSEWPGESAARLNSIYELIKLGDYKPRDREPNH